MQKTWTDIAWEDYLYWQTQDKRTLKRINMILKDIDREPSPVLVNRSRSKAISRATGAGVLMK